MQVQASDPGVREVHVSSRQPFYKRQLSPKENAEQITRFTGPRYRQEAHHTFSEQKIRNWTRTDAVYQAVVSGIPTAKAATTADLKVSQDCMPCVC